MRFLVVLVFSVTLIVYSESLNCDKPDEGINTEVKLKKKLFCNNYDKEIRPGPSNEVTKLNFRYTIKSFDYEDHARTLSVTSWMTLAWFDSRLTWKPSDYDDIKTIHINIDYIWSPDIYLYNAHIASGMGTCHAVDCLISSDGKVACVMPCEHNGHCKVGDYVMWPFDRQNCSFVFGSWMKTGEEMNYNTEKVKLISTRTKQNNQWKLLAATSKVNEGKYDVAPNETYPSITFSFLIERHSAYHISGTIVPAIVLLICNLIVLWMRPSTDRFVLCLFDLFSHFLYMEFLYWLLPYCGDSVPNVLIFFRNSQLIAAFFLVETVFINMLIARSTERRPYLWIQSTVTLGTKNPIGDFLLTPTSMVIEDATDLVESAKKLSSDEVVWSTFCKLIDLIIFLVFLVIYIFMFISLLPEGYLFTKYDPIGSLS